MPSTFLPELWRARWFSLIAINKKIAISLLLMVILMALLFPACQSAPSIAGQWLAEAPSSLLFEFSDDGVVYLLDGANSYQVFRYKFTSTDTIELYDGMGRIRVFTVNISGDTMTFFDIDSGAQIERYQRVSDISK